jgi:hypothetical protein
LSGESRRKGNTGLDYKASAALDLKDSRALTNRKGTLGDKHREDLIRDVAAMANAEGGLIIYGSAERAGGYPKHVDDGPRPGADIATPKKRTPGLDEARGSLKVPLAPLSASLYGKPLWPALQTSHGNERERRAATEAVANCRRIALSGG